ncbi:MAG TPA: DUF1822 family protein [Kamptonema sp.]|nr:DUF1822 family protein [Kamptonema sp.]
MKMLEINQTTEDLTFTVNITSKFRKQAELFRHQQPNPEKGEQVYRNTLAVLAVNFYCQCMGIETDLEVSDSWNPVMRTLLDTADLTIKDLGKLECRAVLSDSDIVEVPAEVGSDRIGYIAVQLSASMKEANLIGFVRNVTGEKMPLNQWRSLEDFLEVVSEPQTEPDIPPYVSRWLRGLLEAGWQTVEAIEALLSPPQTAPSLNFRSLTPIKFKKQDNTAMGGKLLQLEEANAQVAIIVGLAAGEEQEMDFFVELYAVKPQIYLPLDLKLMVLDEQGKSVMQSVATKSSKNMQLKFSGYADEEFSVKVALGDVSIVHRFSLDGES